MTKMQKRWTIHPHRPKPPEPLALEERVARYQAAPNAAHRRRATHHARRAIGHAMSLRGAAKNAAMRRIVHLALDGIIDSEQLKQLRRDYPAPAKKEKVKQA